MTYHSSRQQARLNSLNQKLPYGRSPHDGLYWVGTLEELAREECIEIRIVATVGGTTYETLTLDSDPDNW